MEGIKHLIECQCVLPQYKRREDPPYHQFVVFSMIDDSGSTIEKYSQCNNCGIVHRVFDICRSEISSGNESLNSVITKEDLKMMLPTNISEVLNSYDCETYDWEFAHFIINENKVGEKIIISREEIDGKAQGKMLVYQGENRFTIEPFLTDLEF